MKVLRGTLAAFFLAAPILLFAAAPAHAALSGPCSATGTLNGKTYDSKTVNKAVIPRKGDVHWKGSIPGSGKRAIAGHVQLKLPWPIPAQNLGSWGKQSDTYSNSGVYHYDLPSELEGIDMPLSGSHSEPGKTCSGLVIVRLDGGGVSNPGVLGAFAVLVISSVGIWIALKPKGA
jgi:hypothetical protein